MPPTSQLSTDDVRELADGAARRLDLWVSFVGRTQAATVAEIGVYRGAFAERLLSECESIARYYMVDPWRHLDDWNKPANKVDEVFERYLAEAMTRTAAHADKRVVLRGRTVDVADQIPDRSLDFAYIDGDHTLRGITVDLVRLYPKVREGGFIGGDDFCRSIWQHDERFEPTLVFPMAVYFAEAVGARVYALPHQQFLMQKCTGGRHEFVDLTGRYQATTLHAQLQLRPAPVAPGAPGAEAVPAPADEGPALVRRLAHAIRRRA